MREYSLSEGVLRSWSDTDVELSANANTIICAVWALLEVYRDPSLERRVHSELVGVQAGPTSIHDQASLPASNSTKQSPTAPFDIRILCSSPLLQSIYAETLRLRIAVLVNRTPEAGDIKLDDWVFRKGRMICLSSRTAASNPDLWSTGSTAHPHAIDEFWADRFMVYRDEPNSGPLLKKPRKVQFEDEKEEKNLPRRSPRSPEFSMEGLAGGWIPYGGGQFMCPGRHFAKQEIIGAIALFAAHYELELHAGDDWKVVPDMSFFGLGALPPKGKVPCRLKRRRDMLGQYGVKSKG